jgi:hypothetical protein
LDIEGRYFSSISIGFLGKSLANNVGSPKSSLGKNVDSWSPFSIEGGLVSHKKQINLHPIPLFRLVFFHYFDYLLINMSLSFMDIFLLLIQFI